MSDLNAEFDAFELRAIGRISAGNVETLYFESAEHRKAEHRDAYREAVCRRIARLALEFETIEGFARRVGVPPNVLRDYLSARVLPGYRKLQRIADRLSVPPEWLMFGRHSDAGSKLGGQY